MLIEKINGAKKSKKPENKGYRFKSKLKQDILTT